MLPRNRIIAAIALIVACAPAGTRSPADHADHEVDLGAIERRASTLMEAGEFAAAIRDLEMLAREAPNNERVFLLLGDAHRGLGDSETAIENYEQAIRLNYGVYIPHLKLGTLLMELGKTGRALTEFEVAVKYGGDDPLTRYNYGLALDRLGRGDQALTQWRIARDLDPADVRYAEAVGIGLTGSDPTAAIESFETARDLGADGASFHNNFALALEAAGRLDEARVHFETATRLSDKEQYRFNLALNHMRAERHEDAAREWDALTRAYGPRWSYAVYGARALVSLSRYDDAVAALDPFAVQLAGAALDRDAAGVDRVPPTLADALAALGMAWRGSGKLDRARDCLQRAVALEPTNPSHLNNYGVALAEGGMLAEARAQWRRALEIDPDDSTAKANLSAYER